MRRFVIRVIALTAILIAGYANAPRNVFALEGCDSECEDLDFQNCYGMSGCDFIDTGWCMDQLDSDCARVCEVAGGGDGWYCFPDNCVPNGYKGGCNYEDR